MRVRLDSRGRPRRSALAPPPPPSSTTSSSSSSSSPSPRSPASVPASSALASASEPESAVADPHLAAAPLFLPPVDPLPPAALAPPPPPSPAPVPTTTPSKPPAPPLEPLRSNPRPPLPQSASSSACPPGPPVPRPPDDERASDSGSSVAEPYNSEDEHSSAARLPDHFHARSPLERERVFASQLRTRGLRIVDMRADGNCLFRALAHGLWGDPELHLPLRAKVIDYLVQERDYFSQFVAEDFARYVRRKSRDGTHGNHLELQAAAELFGRPIEVYSYGPTPVTLIDSWGTRAGDASARRPEPIRLSFHRGSHYNAVEPAVIPGEKRAAQAKRERELQWRSAVDAQATQIEMERAVVALSLVEASRRESAAGSSASSSTPMLPSTVLALIHAGYTEERANEAYQVAGHGGLGEMVRYLTTDFFNPKSYTPPSSRYIARGSTSTSTGGSVRSSQPSRLASEPSAHGTDRKSEATATLKRTSGTDAPPVNTETNSNQRTENTNE